ncbi:MAG: hypothetical protein QF561_04555 [Phycisphaerales bacterium]|jgi:hypothetical protein|nr:hypothetical protein [Phycisphaerales bacterium]
MSRRRAGRAAPISFFSFQDVMIGTIGVVLIITLVLLLSIGKRTSQAVAAVYSEDSEEAVESLRARLEELQARPGRDVILAELEQLQAALELEAGLVESRRWELESLQTQAANSLRRGDLAELDRLATREGQLQGELEAIKRRRQISYLVADDDSDALVTELMGGRVVLSRTDPRIAPRMRTGTPEQIATAALEAWLTASTSRPTHLLLSIKPSGFAAWQAIMRKIDRDPRFSDVAVGIDLISEDSSTTGQFPGRRSEP